MLTSTLTNHCFQVFLDGERATAYLTGEIRNELVKGAAFAITGHYYELAADLVNVVGVKILNLLIQRSFQLIFSE